MNSNILKQVGDRMAQARHSLHFTQHDIAEQLGVSPVTVSRWETAQREIALEDLVRFAGIVDKPISYFFVDEDKVDINHYQMAIMKLLQAVSTYNGAVRLESAGNWIRYDAIVKAEDHLADAVKYARKVLEGRVDE